jgi:UDP-N-acetylmuramyl pentapeptide phosphotransferase/UDP-N-acetylglucosamine-1-phosphate transferase
VRPNSRSSHKTPTPQGGGLAVISATLLVASFIMMLSQSKLEFPAWIFGATLFIAAVGAADDLKPIPVLPRLVLQTLAVGTVVFAAPTDLHIVPSYPLWLERGVLLVAGLWFVNLVNFMDGLDLMTVAETFPITAAVVTLGVTGDLDPMISMVAAALGGAMIGFAPFNRPVAKVFLGDVGSLPIGLLLGWCLLELAFRGHLIAALLLPLYYLSDATSTMLLRLIAGDKIWIAHRTHFYQRATANGFTVSWVVGTVFALNLGLVGLALASIAISSFAARIGLFIIGALAVSSVMTWFVRRR